MRFFSRQDFSPCHRSIIVLVAAMVCMHQIMEFCGGNFENSTGAYVGIEPSRVMVKIVNHLNQGIDAGVVI
jgi:hypothetical protein